MSEELSLEHIVNTVNERYTIAKQKGYNNYAEMIWEDCIIKNPTEIFTILTNELQSVKGYSNTQESFISVDNILPYLFEAVSIHFNLGMDKIDDIFKVTNSNGDCLGSFQLVLHNPSEYGTWFEVVDSNTGIVNMNLVEGELLSGYQAMLLFHELGHAIHHITTNLETVPPDLWELGGLLGEELYADYFDYGRPDDELKQDIAIALVDLELSLSSGVTEQEVIRIVEHVQNYVGVNLTLSHFEGCINGMYGAVYWTYPYCRSLVRLDRAEVIKKVGN